MYYFLCGMDRNEPETFARALKKKGFTAVICDANQRQIDALNQAGLKAYLCVNAFPLKDGGDVCRDIEGIERVWFSSGCPCDESAMTRSLDRIAASARLEGLAGVYLDGARFASPASFEGDDAFFTCFCPHCQARARELGIDLEKARRDMISLKRRETSVFSPEMAKFRALVVADYFDRFIQVVHGIRAGLEANAFVFAASLMHLVGQVPDAWRGLDALSPMLYRAFPQEFGTACLSHEYAALLRMFGRDTTQALTGVTPPDDPRYQGFMPQALARETRAARAQFSGRLEPIIQLDDPLLPASIQAVQEGGADGCGFFSYHGQGADAIPTVG